MATRAHRKGFKPLPEDGWHEYRDGPWKYYVERCVHEGAQVGNDDVYGEYINWINDNGLPHREDGPVIEQENGYKMWYVNGRPHRLDGPAFEQADGYRAWYVNGQRHRLDGPAIERLDGSVEFYKDGTRYTDITFTQRFDDE